MRETLFLSRFTVTTLYTTANLYKMYLTRGVFRGGGQRKHMLPPPQEFCEQIPPICSPPPLHPDNKMIAEYASVPDVYTVVALVPQPVPVPILLLHVEAKQNIAPTVSPFPSLSFCLSLFLSCYTQSLLQLFLSFSVSISLCLCPSP